MPAPAWSTAGLHARITCPDAPPWVALVTPLKSGPPPPVVISPLPLSPLPRPLLQAGITPRSASARKGLRHEEANRRMRNPPEGQREHRNGSRSDRSLGGRRVLSLGMLEGLQIVG